MLEKYKDIAINYAKSKYYNFNSWEKTYFKRKLKDISKISAGGDLEKVDKNYNGEYPILSNSLANEGIIGYSKSFKITEPSITVTGRGSVGFAVARHINYTPVVRLLSLKPFNHNINVDYLANEINSIRTFNESTGVPQLTSPQLGSYTVNLVDYNSQKFIGDLIILLNLREHNQSKKIKKLKLLKKFLMQNMFI